MTAIQFSALGILATFYTAYFTKILLQRRQGIQTDQIGKGNKPRKILVVERLMKLATYAIIPVEIISIQKDFSQKNLIPCWLGLTVAVFGVLIFVLAMSAMRDSWRAGIPDEDETDLITTGIYTLSRNPAFLGFDLMYIGLLMEFFNWFHFVFALFAIVMLHLQILQEEAFLEQVFGAKYLEYKKRTGRYFLIL